MPSAENSPRLAQTGTVSHWFGCQPKFTRQFPLEDAKTPAKQGFGAPEKFGRSAESRPFYGGPIGKKDFEVIAQRYLDNWIAHIESDLGFIRRYAHFDMDRSRLAVQVGWISLSGARGGAFSGVVPLIKRGYTPKWVDEFYDADELRLKSIYRDIQSAYTNNQIEAMTQAMARVPAHFGRADGRPYFDGDKYLEIFFDDHFINDGISRRFDSLPEFARFLALNTEMALFLCNYDKDLSRTPIEPTELKRKTTKMLKGYVDELHREGRKDFERVAQKYLDIWTAHSVATPSLNWLNKFK